MSEPKTKMTLLLTRAERARLDSLRLARGDRHASATLRALVRDAGGDPPRAPAPAPHRRSENTLGLIDLAPGAVLPDPPRAPAVPRPKPAPDPLDTAEDDGAAAFLDAVRRAAAAAIDAELGSARVADVAARVVQALPHWAGGDPPDPLRPAHVRGAARAARALADALDQLAERA